MGDGDGVDPGITGLGNFKGVMLCNRPDATGSLQSQKSELKPFYSSVAPGALEPLGMLTKKDPSDQPPPRRREEAPALKRHREWIKQLQVGSFLRRWRSFWIIFRSCGGGFLGFLGLL